MALFIGSFNPPTKAHLKIALEIRKYLDKIIMIPVNNHDKHLISIKDRINMLAFYQKKYSFIKVDDIMKNYSYFNYHILDLLCQKYNDYNIVIGSDILKKLNAFENSEYILNKYHFYVVTRNGDDVKKIINNDYLDYNDKFKIIDMNFDCSSTIARETIKNKGNLNKILDKDVISYIRNNHLYF